MLKRSPLALRLTVSPAVTPVSAVQSKRVQEPSEVRWAVPPADAEANTRTANKMAFTTIPSNAQRHQLNNAQSDYQHRHRHVVVIEPMPSSHDPLPLFERPVFPSSRERFTAPLFQGDFAGRLFGFAVWGENLAGVSRFVAEIGPRLRGGG
jgi:hypothetical protein